VAEQTTRFWLARGHISEGRLWLERVLLIPTTDPSLRARVLRSAGHLEYWQEQYDQARNHLTESLAIAREMGDQTGAARRLVLLALVADAQDDHTTARDLLLEAERIFTQAGDLPGLLNAWISLAMNPRLGAEADEAERTAINAFELARTLGDWGRMLEALMIRQAMAIERRDAETARRLLLEGLQIARDTANVAHFTVSIWLVMELAWLRGQPDWVVRLAATERSMRSVTGANLIAPSRRRREGLLERARVKVGARRASALWHEGLNLEMDDVISYVDGKGVLSVPGGLSSRELEVARLVAAGLTDKEIGRALKVTARTAETHLANIRNKLGLRSRSEVAVWVAEQLAPIDT